MIKKRVAVLCSGGVDSSVVLHILKMQDYDVTAFYLRIWLEDELAYLGDCPWEEDFSYVKKTCELLDVPCEQIPFQKEYWNNVVETSIVMLKKGLTPNPDIFCNQFIKFGAFFELFKDTYDYIATGHYASLLSTDGMTYLRLCKDRVKDQTYFLSYVPSLCFNKVLFPIGTFENKELVREYAKEYMLPSAKRKDSQGICFLGKISFFDFVKYHCGEKEGVLINYETGKKEGTHPGFWFFTIGQRQGIGLSGGPWYVVGKDVEKNIIYISRYKFQKKDTHFLKISVLNFNSLVKSEEFLLIGKEYQVKVRHGEQTNRVLVENIEQDKKKIIVTLFSSDQAIADGQCMVFYRDDGIVIGAGIMSLFL